MKFRMRIEYFFYVSLKERSVNRLFVVSVHEAVCLQFVSIVPSAWVILHQGIFFLFYSDGLLRQPATEVSWIRRVRKLGVPKIPLQKGAKELSPGF